MTEQNYGLPFQPDQGPHSEFEMPTDSVLAAEADRDYYESMFVYQMTKTADMPDELFTPAEKTAVLQSRIAYIKMFLTSEVYDPQVVLDAIDIETLAKETTIEVSTFGILTEELPVEGYQMENRLRGGANIVREAVDPDNSKTRRALVKRFKEAKKLAEEKGVSEEAVFQDQDLYFQLVRRSTSPEDVYAQTQSELKKIKAVLPSLRKHEHRTGMIIANADNPSIDIDTIDSRTERYNNRPDVRASISEDISKLEDYFDSYTQAVIERYWGRETANLFFRRYQ